MNIPNRLNPLNTTLKHLGLAFHLDVAPRVSAQAILLASSESRPADHIKATTPIQGTQTLVRLKASK